MRVDKTALDRQISEACHHRLMQIRHDRDIVKRRIRRSSRKDVIRGLRKLNNLLEATERELENA